MSKALTLLLTFFCAISIIVLYPHVNRPHWSHKTKTDLQCIYTTIKENHPGPVDPDANPHFKLWFESGYAKALKRAESAQTWPEHMFTLLYYVNGFKDAHVRLNCSAFYSKLSIQWPGFLLEYRNGLFYVAHTEQEWNTTLPPIGAEIIQLNNKNPRQLMLSNIFPYFGNEQFERDWVKNTPLLLLDCGNTWQEPICSCTYKTNDGQHTITLHQKEVPYESLQPLMRALSYRSMHRSNKFITKELEDNGVWIAIPTFNGDNPELHNKLEELIARASQLSDKEYIVFDVRGNGGGASDYAERITRNLFGHNLVNSTLSWMLDAPRSYRVSPDNNAHYKKLLHSVTERYGNNSEAYKWVQGMLTCVEDAYAEKKSLCTYQPAITSTKNDNSKQEHCYKKPIFLLTDGGCFSACLMFADMLFAFDNVIQVGLPTGGDTPYAEVRTVKLLGENVSLLIPTNIRHNLPRTYNECYIPHHRYQGDIHDTAALEKWIASLYQSMQK